MEDETNEIWCLDDLSTGRMENIEHFLKDPRFTFLEQDVQKPVDLDVQQIYHAACPASPPAYQKDPVNTTKTCVLGTLNMLELARKYGAVLVNFSTSEVYGDPEAHPQREDYRGNVNPTGVRSCYDEGKRCAESLCFDYVREYGTAVKVIRIFNTYGKKYGSGGRARGQQFYYSGVKGRRSDGIRRRLPDQKLLPCGRSGGGNSAHDANAQRSHRPVNLGTRRIYGARAR